jgi:pilus assembly protein CpaC
MKRKQHIAFRPLRTMVAIGCLLIGAIGLAPSAYAQAQITVASSSYGGQRNLDLELNKSMIVDLPAGVAEVIVSQPGVAAAIMRTRTRAIVQGIGGGDTNIFFLDDAGRTIQVLDLRVIKEPSQVGNALEEALSRVIPGSRIAVESVTLKDDTNRVVLTGTVLSSDDRDRANQVAVQFAGDAANVANIIEIAGGQQVMLQVTVSEVRRNVAKQLGINLSGSVAIGSLNLGLNSAQNTLPNGISGVGSLGNVQINASLRALEARGALRLLAQPTLTAVSGQSAKFLVGGEFPVPINNPNGITSIEYKPYGVELEFKPTVKSNGTIALEVKTGVSEVQAGSYALTRRDVNTSVELAIGSTLAIGGLLSESVTQAVDQMPGLGDIPILGALFRSRDFRREETELVVLVTPYLVNPSPVNSIAVPTDHSLPATDAEAIFLGRLEQQYGVGHGGMRGGFGGSVGFVLD